METMDHATKCHVLLQMKPFNNFGGDDSALLVVPLVDGFVVKKFGEKLALCGLDL